MLCTYTKVNELYFPLYDISYFNACLFRNAINIPPDDDDDDDDYFGSHKIMGAILLLFTNITH